MPKLFTSAWNVGFSPLLSTRFLFTYKLQERRRFRHQDFKVPVHLQITRTSASSPPQHPGLRNKPSSLSSPLRRSALSPPRRPLLSRFQDTIESQLLSRINKTQGFSSPRKFSQVSPSPVSKWGDSLSYKGFAFPFQANLRLSCCRALSRL